MNKSKKTFEKLFCWIGILGASASIICLVYVMIDNPDWRNLYIALTSCLYIVALIIITVFHTKEREILLEEKCDAQIKLKEAMVDKERACLEAKQAAAFESVFPDLHAISHAFRDEYERLNNHPISSLDDLKGSRFLLCTADILKMIYDRITGKTCAVCIRLHIEKQKILVPIARDAASSAQRGLFDSWGIGGYGATSVKSNTASQRIIINGENFFVEDDLMKLKDREGYDNERKDWFQLYRSTLVLPIRFYNEATQEKHIPALLGIDSRATGIFNNNACIEIGATVTDMMYIFFTHPNFNISTLPPVRKP
jgi:hypothetical protein